MIVCKLLCGVGAEFVALIMFWVLGRGEHDLNTSTLIARLQLDSRHKYQNSHLRHTNPYWKCTLIADTATGFVNDSLDLPHFLSKHNLNSTQVSTHRQLHHFIFQIQIIKHSPDSVLFISPTAVAYLPALPINSNSIAAANFSNTNRNHVSW